MNSEVLFLKVITGGRLHHSILFLSTFVEFEYQDRYTLEELEVFALSGCSGTHNNGVIYKPS
eukprot:COSAG06_NODE_1066_length_10841_cov_14.808806_12_plen_62_part_00